MAVAFADALTGEPRCERDASYDRAPDEAADPDAGDDHEDAEAAELDDGDDPSCEATAVRPGPRLIDPEPPSRDPSDEADAPYSNEWPNEWPNELDGSAEPGDAADPPGDGYLSDGSSELVGSREPIEIESTSRAFLETELYDPEAHHRRPSRWGRVDVSLAWHRSQALRTMSRRRDDELLLLATWRR
ncbi:MAG: hypothetical protein H6Q90_1512 [Deltaproteobacteria bacterium]|nr:hypothetical protein [Deltaproteobacteria bacterium]